MELLEFYPTPETLLEKILDGVKWNHIHTILEPSAGKGDIVSYILKAANKYPFHNTSLNIDCIEKDANLQKILKGNDMRVVYDDFLTYRTFKEYDLIILNPPFSEGDKHLSKALAMQEKTGGDVVCILNAETIRNPYTNLRKELVNKLNKVNADIQYMTHEFSSAERTTDVEIAVVKAHFEKPESTSLILDGLKQKSYPEDTDVREETNVAPSDVVENAVRAYELEVAAGIKLIKEYLALAPKLINGISEEEKRYAHPLIELKTDDYGCNINSYVEATRMKYWRAFFSDKRITGNMTSDLQCSYMRKVRELKDYDFSVYNIKEIQYQMAKNIVSGVEECIIDLFDELSHQYSWYDSSSNIHLYNGWKTNKAWIVNKKVILPFYDAFDNYSKEFDPTDYKVVEKISDIEKAFNYLDCGQTGNVSMEYAFRKAKETGNTKNIRLKYFDITFYKKGTCHIVFRNEELLKKFNIFGSQKKGWLPPSYGKKRYTEMDAEEKAVIDEFEGEVSYNRTIANASYYLFDASNVLMIEEKAA
nr:DUF4942 domain-containing protein [uncultured Butyrivibrio sp.]